ncbi:MAG: MoaD/ThiS family protein [Nitrospinae bacterium]|nr:MoaD/ThiS family protein [Nitrospinota bacterium]
MARILLFASIKDRAGTGRIDVPLTAPTPLRAVLAKAAAAAGIEEGILSRGCALFAVNQETVPLDHLVNDGDEVALLPPMSGGR